MSLTIDRRLNPCRGICSSSAVGSAYCVGCGRSKEQVDNWNKGVYSDAEKIEIMEAVETRAIKMRGFPS